MAHGLRRARLGGLLVAALMLVSACSGGGASGGGPASTGGDDEPVRGGILKVATTIPSTIDPMATTLGVDWAAASNVCESLFATNSKYEPQPMLVDTWDYDKATKTYTFTLRSDVSFQNGEPLTADDVVASLQRFASSAGQGAIFKSLVKKIAKTDEHTVTVALTKPSAIIPALLSTPPSIIMPASVVKGVPASQGIKDLVCTGPYKLAEFKPDQIIRMVRWDGYTSRSEPSDAASGKKSAWVDEIDFVTMPETSVQQQSLITGEINVGGPFPLKLYDSLKANPNIKTTLRKNQQFYTMVFNKVEGWGANVDFRRAVLAALDMKEVMQSAVGTNPDFYTLTPSWVPDPNSIWYSDVGADKYNHKDLDKVHQLLAKAGYHGEPIRWITTKDAGWYAPVPDAVQQLKDAGINIDLQVMDLATLVQTRLQTDKYDVFSSVLPTYADPTLIPYFSASYAGFWKDPKKEEMLQNLSTEVDQSKRLDIWHELLAYTYDQVPFIEFGAETSLGATTANVHNIPTSNASGAIYYNVWMSKS